MVIYHFVLSTFVILILSALLLLNSLLTVTAVGLVSPNQTHSQFAVYLCLFGEILFILYSVPRFLIYAEMATLGVQLSKWKRNCKHNLGNIGQ